MRGLCDRLRQHVLLLAGERDHYIPQGQYGILMQEITSAHTLTGRMFSSQEGGEQHCQVGNHMIAISTILDWLRDTVWPK